MTRSIARVLLAAPLLIACGAAPSPAPLPLAVTPSSTPSASLDDAGGAPVLPPDVDGVASVVPPTDGSPCVLTATELDRVLVLRAKPGGAPFAALRGRTVKATLLPSGGFFVEAETGALRVRGYVDPDDAVVFGTRAIAFGGIVTSTPYTELRVVAAPDGSPHAALRDSGLRWDAPTDTPVACAELALSAQSFAAVAATLKKALAGHWRFRTTADVAIAPDAAAKPVARVDSVVGDVSVLEVRGPRARVEIGDTGKIVSGWVAAAALHTVSDREVLLEETRLAALMVMTSEMGQSPTLGSLSASPARGTWTITPVPVAAVEQLTCPVDVRLIGDVGGARTWLGSVGTGAIIRVLSREAVVAHVVLANAAQGAFTPPAYETLLLPTRDLAACASQAITADAPYVAKLASENPPPPPRASDLHGVVALSFVSAGKIADAEKVVRARIVVRASACYRRALEAAPTTSGKLVATLEVEPSGDIATVNVEPSDGLPKRVADCVASMLRLLEFAPRPPGAGRAPVSIGLTFSLPP